MSTLLDAGNAVAIAVQEPYLTITEAANFLHLAKSSVYGLVSKGHIPYYKPKHTKKVLFKKSSLVAWVENEK